MEKQKYRKHTRWSVRVIEGLLVLVAVLAVGHFVVTNFLTDEEPVVETTTETVADAETYADRGDDAYDEGEYRAAIELYTVALELDPENYSYYNNRGMAYNDLGEYDEAIEDFTRSLELGNNEPHLPYNNRGTSYHDLEKYEEAIDDYTRAIESNPDYALAYYNRALVYANMDEHQKALADYTRALNLDPDDEKARNNRALIYEELGDYERAIEDYTYAMEMRPDYALGYRNRGSSYADMGEYERSLADLNRAIEIEPDNPRGYNLRGITHRYLGEYEKAISDYTRAIELGHTSLHFPYSNRAYIYRVQGDYDRALEDYNRALELVPTYSTAFYGKARTYELLGEAQQSAFFDQQWLDAAVTQTLELPAITPGESLQRDLDDTTALVVPFDGIDGQRVVIEVTGSEDDDLDTLLVLRAPDGTPLVSSSDYGDGLTARIIGYELPESGTYSIATALEITYDEPQPVVIRVAVD